VLAGLGVSREDLPPLQPLFQHRVWERSEPGEGPERLAAVIGELSAGDNRFSNGGRQLDQRHLMDARVRQRAGTYGACERALRQALAGLAGRPATLATGARCFICWPVKPAATATGAGASGRITAPSSPAAPARPPARRPDRRAARTEGEGRGLRHRRVVPAARCWPPAPCRTFRPGSARNCGLPGGPARWCPARSLFLVPRVWALMRRRAAGELGGVLVTGQGHGTWQRSYRAPGRAAAVPGDLAS
jgi:hypothetical protein